MRLVAFRLEGYRRFEKQSTLDLTPRVVALVGPNEAGKTSLLNALELVTADGRREFTTSDFSGRVEPPGHRIILSALFELEDDDKAALEGIPGAHRIRLLHRYRTADGIARQKVVPEIKRPRATRDEVTSTLRRVLARAPRRFSELMERDFPDLADEPQVSDDGTEEPRSPVLLRAALSELLESVDNDDSDLSVQVRERLRVVSQLLADNLDSKGPVYIRRLPALLSTLADEHDLDPPAVRAVEVLSRRRPKVRVLRETDRQLETGYAFDDHESAPDPLENLLQLAGVGWDDLKEAAAEPGNPYLATLITRANRRLRERLHGSWRQAEVSVELREQQGVLHVFPFDAASETHSRIEDRSDGFRSFLALLAFTTRHSQGQRRLILAIDEAELHLHYDAQADLVRVLTQQTLVPQIIYSTHSAGCLPEDLGSAIRVVRTVAGDRSVIDNGFWSSGVAGFTSLLMAMGAGAVAFTPARRAVITEGPSDALLLPALLRAAMGYRPDRPLGLQVVGGLAWTPPAQLAALETEAAHVVYVTDGDDAGMRYHERLIEARVARSHILALGEHGSRLTIEDFVHKESYVKVINDLLTRLHDYDGPPLRVHDIPSAGAAAEVERWMRKQGIAPLSKTAVAENLLRVSRASLAYMHWEEDVQPGWPLVRRERAGALRQLLRRIAPLLGLDAPGAPEESSEAA